MEYSDLIQELADDCVDVAYRILTVEHRYSKDRLAKQVGCGKDNLEKFLQRKHSAIRSLVFAWELAYATWDPEFLHPFHKDMFRVSREFSPTDADPKAIEQELLDNVSSLGKISASLQEHVADGEYTRAELKADLKLAEQNIQEAMDIKHILEQRLKTLEA